MTLRAFLVFVLLSTASCKDRNNSADTDRSGSALAQAQSDLREKRSEVTARETDIEREKRDLAQHQQALADGEKALASDRDKVGSASDALVRARATYGTSVTARMAKLDADLATLSTKTDAASKDAVVGLHARRDQLATTVATMDGLAEADWAAYTKAVDTTFDAIERDLHATR